MNDRSHCQHPDNCTAKGAGHCRRCHFTAVAKALHADPEFVARLSAKRDAWHDRQGHGYAHRKALIDDALASKGRETAAAIAARHGVSRNTIIGVWHRYGAASSSAPSPASIGPAVSSTAGAQPASPHTE